MIAPTGRRPSTRPTYSLRQNAASAYSANPFRSQNPCKTRGCQAAMLAAWDETQRNEPGLSCPIEHVQPGSNAVARAVAQPMARTSLLYFMK